VNDSDLIALAPWLLFGGGLGVVCIRLLTARHRPSRMLGPRRCRHRHGRVGPGDSP
jgi:hypothetical protein